MFHSISNLNFKKIKCDDITVPSKQNNDKIPLKWIPKLSVIAFCVYLSNLYLHNTLWMSTSYSSMTEISKRGDMARHHNGERTMKKN